jgi:signal transduction histidine kinase
VGEAHGAGTAAQSAAGGQPDSAPVRILLVDDRPQNLLTLEAMLGDLGLDLVRVQSGAEALRRVLQDDFAVILLDVLMPGMDGLETAALIRKRERSRDTPIIFITAAGRDEDLIARGYALGAVDYVVKPIHPAILRCKVAVFAELFRTTAQVRQQAAQLARLNEELEARVAARTLELQRTVKALKQQVAERKRAEAERAQFLIAMVTHELGSPLAAIRCFLDMLASGELAPAEQAQALATMRTETALLTALVSNVQAAATVERDDFAVQPRPVPVSALLAAAAAFARALPGHHPLSTTITTHERVWADPERIGQVLRNLLGNAAKFAPAGTPIELRAALHAGRVRIAVADHGFGIHPDDVARIFEKFERGRNPSGRKIVGVGLGLYLSRRIVRAHGGELSVDSTSGTGAVFTFDLEVAR